MSRPNAWAMIGVLAAAGAGCAPGPVKFLVAPEPAVVWPQPPDEPRVRFVGELRGSEDLGAGKPLGQVMDELLYGPQRPARLISPVAVAVDAGGRRVAVADLNAKCVHVFDVESRAYEALVAVGASGAIESPVGVCWVGEALWVSDSVKRDIAVFGGSGPDGRAPEAGSGRDGRPPAQEGGRHGRAPEESSGRDGHAPAGVGRWLGIADLKRPAGLAWCKSNGLVYIADAGGHAIRACEADGKVALSFGSHGSGPGQFNFPVHVACGADMLVVSDSLNFRVQRLALDGSPLGEFGRKGDAAGDLALPKGVAVAEGGIIWVVDANFENLQAFTADGRLLMALGREGHGPGEFWLPAGVCIDGQKRMWVADTYNRRVQVFQLLTGDPVPPQV